MYHGVVYYSVIAAFILTIPLSLMVGSVLFIKYYLNKEIKND